MSLSIPIPADLDATLRQWEGEIEKHPKRAAARLGFAAALRDADDPAGAIEQSSLALALDPKLHDAARMLASLLQKYEINPEIDVSPRGLEAAFTFHDVDRQALSTSAISLLKAQAPLDGILATARTQDWDAAARSLQSKSGRGLLKNRLWRTALIHGFNTDPEIEELLTAFRRFLLLGLASDRLRDRALYEFACAMIRQCANNEYVFFAADDENEKLRQVEEILQNSVPGNSNGTDALLLLALYRPAHEIVPALEDQARLGKAAPRALRSVLQRQWEDRRDDDERAQSIDRLTGIADDTSRRVAQQYADDPYPRWLSLQTPVAGATRQTLNTYFENGELAFLENPYHVLIAGCGTGQQAVSSALGYGPDADVLAIDLSPRSLAYAAGMAEQYRVGNLRFAQADILGLADSSETYDVIECVGVLHHMAKPYDAWRILVDRLRPGGLMLIGLYSAISRQNLSLLRDDPSWPGTDADDDALRRYRQTILRRPPGDAGTELLISRDFYTKDGFRDLALHVSEQHCTLSEIEPFLKGNGLAFHGFQLPAHLIAGFLESYPDEQFPGSLRNWHAFEEDNPRTFDGMYVFWCRKA